MGGVGGLAAAVLAGFLFSFTPIAFASIPMVLAYVTRARELKEVVSFGSAFTAGLILTHVLLGIGAALGGAWAQDLLSRRWGIVVGPLLILLILLGLLWTGWIRLPLPWLPLRGRALGRLSARHTIHRGHLPGVLAGVMDWSGGQRLDRLGGLRWHADVGLRYRPGHSPGGGGHQYRLAGKSSGAAALAACLRNHGRNGIDRRRPLFA